MVTNLYGNPVRKIVFYENYYEFLKTRNNVDRKHSYNLNKNPKRWIRRNCLLKIIINHNLYVSNIYICNYVIYVLYVSTSWSMKQDVKQARC